MEARELTVRECRQIRRQTGAERWYVVPDYRTDQQPATSATVVNECGEQVASFEHIADAERCVEAVNRRA